MADKPRLAPYCISPKNDSRFRYVTGYEEECGAPDEIIHVDPNDHTWIIYEGIDSGRRLAQGTWKSDDIDDACAAADLAAGQWYEIPDGPYTNVTSQLTPHGRHVAGTDPIWKLAGYDSEADYDAWRQSYPLDPDLKRK